MHVLTLTVPEGNYYPFFYNLAFFAALAVLIFEGHRRRFPLLKWVILLAISRLMFIVGSKVVTFSLSDWQLVFQTFTWPHTTEKSLFGGLLFSCGALLAGKYLLRFRQNFLDAFAVALPLGIAIMRLGCFSAGCCFGKHAVLPWSVQYPANTLAHFYHFRQGLIHFPDAYSMPVHPVQLYETAGVLLVAALLIFLRKRFKAPGSLLALSFIMTLSVRFLTEFFRDPLAHSVGGNYWWVLNATQWGILVIITALIVILRLREASHARLPGTHPAHRLQEVAAENENKRLSGKGVVLPEGDLSAGNALLWLTVFTMVFFLIGNWLTYAENLAIGIILFAGVVVTAFSLVRGLILSPIRWVYLTCLLGPPLLISQTQAVNSGDSLLVTTYRTLSVGLASGKLYNSHDIGTGSGCGRVSMTEYFEQDYSLFGVGYAETRFNPVDESSLSYGLKLVAGRHDETRISDRRDNNMNIAGITPWVSWETRIIGLGAGLHMGSLGIITENQEVESNARRPESGTTRTIIYPQLYFRIGPPEIIFVDTHIANQFPSALPGLRFQTGLGSSFGMDNGFMLRTGISSHGYYANALVPIRDRLIFEPMLVIGRPYLDRQRNNFQFSVGLHYRLASY
jgi:prolipoprotein diacylglyceryltransferase